MNTNSTLESLVIDRIETPNPNTMKFCPIGYQVSPDFPVEFNKNDLKINSPLAQSLLERKNVESVFFGENFISVSKSSDITWEEIQSDIVFTILRHDRDIIEGKIFDGIFEEDDKIEYEESDAENVGLIKDFLDEVIRPQIAMDGGDIQLKAYKNKIAYLKLKGACSSCPSAGQTLYHGVREMLITNIPDLCDIEQVF